MDIVADTEYSYDINSLLSIVKHSTKVELQSFIEEIPKDQRASMFLSIDENKYSILHLLAETKWSDSIVIILSSLNDFDCIKLLRMTVEHKQTALHLLAQNSHLRVIIEILGKIHSSKMLALMKCKDVYGNTVLHTIVKNDLVDSSLVKMILAMMEERDRIDLLMTQNIDMYTAFQLSAIKNETLLAMCMIKSVVSRNRPALVEMQTTAGRTTLHIAVEGDNLPLVKLIIHSLPTSAISTLLQIKTQSQRTAYDLAVKRQFVGPMQYLLEVQSEYVLNSVTKLSSTTSMLQRAVSHKNSEAVKSILELCSEDQLLQVVMGQDENLRTVLHLAMRKSDVESTEYILSKLKENESFSLLQLQNRRKETAFHVWLTNEVKDERILKCLLNSLDLEDRLSILQIPNLEQNTALHMLANDAKLNEITKIIVDSVKDHSDWVDLLSIKNSQGKTIVQLALEQKTQSDLVRYLLHTCSGGQKMKILSRSDTNDTRRLINHMSFSSEESKELVGESVENTGDTFLHLVVGLNNYKVASQYLSSLGEIDKNRVLSDCNNLGKTPYKVAREHKLKSLLSWAQRQEGFYLLTTPVKVLIIYTTIDREDADTECNYLEQVLPNFQVKVIKKKNLCGDEMLLQIAKAATEEDSGLFVVVMGHGTKGAVWAKDKLVRVQDILNSMNQPVLAGKPKALLLQMCQVKDQTDGVRLREQRTAETGTGRLAAADAPIPGIENTERRINEVSSRTQQNLQAILKHHCSTLHLDPQPCLPEPLLNGMLPPSATDKQRHRMLFHIKQFTSAISEFIKIEKKGVDDGESECHSSDTAITHFDVLHDDFAVVISTINGGWAVRGKLLEMFSDFLQNSSHTDDIYDIFLRTAQRFRVEVPGQTPEYRSTLKRKLCLKNIFKPPPRDRQIRQMNVNILGCLGRRSERLERLEATRQTI